MKYIPYDEVLEFLKWQFGDDFADQQINEFKTIEIIGYGEDKEDDYPRDDD